MKRYLSLTAIVMAMVIALSACGGSGGAATGNDEAEGTAPAQETEAEAPADGGAEEVAVNEFALDTGNVEKMVMSFMTFTGQPADTLVVQDALNAILTPKYGIDLELQITDYASYSQNLTLALSSGQPLDFISTIVAGYTNLQQQGYLLDLEENGLMKNYGPQIEQAIGKENIDACRINGVLYGLPSLCDFATGRGVVVVPIKYLDAIGYALPDDTSNVIKITQEELEQILAQLHEAYPDKETIRPGMFGQYTTLDQLGNDYFGTLTDVGNNLTVMGLTDTPEYRSFVEMVYNWNQLGYVSQDATTDTTAHPALVMAESTLTYMTGGKPGIVAQESGLTGTPCAVFQTGPDVMTSGAVSRFPWAIPINTINPEKAMAMANAFFSDPEISNLIVWGIEGTHYQVKEDGQLTFADGLDAATSGWYHNVAWVLPNQFITRIWEGNSPTLYTDLVNFNNNSIHSKAAGFIFDPTPVQTEITAVTNAYNEFNKSLESGFEEPEAGLAEMSEKMKAAGLDAIIAEKQRQLDAWAQAAGVA